MRNYPGPWTVHLLCELNIRLLYGLTLRVPMRAGHAPSRQSTRASYFHEDVRPRGEKAPKRCRPTLAGDAKCCCRLSLLILVLVRGFPPLPGPHLRQHHSRCCRCGFHTTAPSHMRAPHLFSGTALVRGARRPRGHRGGGRSRCCSASSAPAGATAAPEQRPQPPQRAHGGRSSADDHEIAAGLAVTTREPIGLIKQALRNDGHAVLGTDSLVHLRGTGVQWTPADHLCVAGQAVCRQVPGTTWMLSGKIHAVEQGAASRMRLLN